MAINYWLITVVKEQMIIELMPFLVAFLSRSTSGLLFVSRAVYVELKSVHWLLDLRAARHRDRSRPREGEHLIRGHFGDLKDHATLPLELPSIPS